MTAYATDLMPGYYKVDTIRGGGFVHALMFNPETGDEKAVLVDDLEYERSFVLANCPHAAEYDALGVITEVAAYREALRDINGIADRPVVGCRFEVVKGRKYAHGANGHVTKVYRATDFYGRDVGLYIHGRDEEGGFYKLAAANCAFSATPEMAEKLEALRLAAMEAVGAIEAA